MPVGKTFFAQLKDKYDALPPQYQELVALKPGEEGRAERTHAVRHYMEIVQELAHHGAQPSLTDRSDEAQQPGVQPMFATEQSENQQQVSTTAATTVYNMTAGGTPTTTGGRTTTFVTRRQRRLVGGNNQPTATRTSAIHNAGANPVVRGQSQRGTGNVVPQRRRRTAGQSSPNPSPIQPQRTGLPLNKTGGNNANNGNKQATTPKSLAFLGATGGTETRLSLNRSSSAVSSSALTEQVSAATAATSANGSSSSGERSGVERSGVSANFVSEPEKDPYSPGGGTPGISGEMDLDQAIWGGNNNPAAADKSMNPDDSMNSDAADIGVTNPRGTEQTNVTYTSDPHHADNANGAGSPAAAGGNPLDGPLQDASMIISDLSCMSVSEKKQKTRAKDEGVMKKTGD